MRIVVRMNLQRRITDRPRDQIPEDLFRIRIAIVRTAMGWNYVEAQQATGINAETWRLWEKGERRCSDLETASIAISAATGYSRIWLIVGGPLTEPGTAAPPPALISDSPTVPYAKRYLAILPGGGNTTAARKPPLHVLSSDAA